MREDTPSRIVREQADKAEEQAKQRYTLTYSEGT